ncbi:MAG: TetR family transcriptional regulator [Betaproteobacteria bacterium]|nr:TetR family transcriptional regulator [Betaproteobacteria bacterium]
MARATQTARTRQASRANAPAAAATAHAGAAAAPRPPQAEAILEAAARAFAERGFPGASMSELARDCGVSKALLYHYYTNKEEILFDMTERYIARLVALCAEIEVRRLPPREHLAALIRAFLGEYQTSQHKHMVLTHDFKFLDAPRRAIIVGRQRAVIDTFRRAISAATDGKLSVAAALPAAMLVFGMINWTFTWLKPAGPMSYAEFAEWVIRMIEGGIGNLAAPPARLAAKRSGRK